MSRSDGPKGRYETDLENKLNQDNNKADKQKRLSKHPLQPR